jgi:PPOX class probable F420-dependent enzyme
MALKDEKYMALTTFRRNGVGVTTPVWVADLGDNKVGFWTSSESGKAKRLRHTSRVTVQPSNGRGTPKPGTQPIEAQAHLVTGAELEAVRTRIVAKYGVMTKFTKFAAKLIGAIKRKPFPYADIAIVIELPA